MVRIKEQPLELGRTQFRGPTYVRSYSGPTQGWNSIERVVHEHCCRTTRRIVLSTKPVRDKKTYIVTTKIVFKNGHEIYRHSNFEGGLDAILALATQLCLRDYKAQKCVKICA